MPQNMDKASYYDSGPAIVPMVVASLMTPKCKVRCFGLSKTSSLSSGGLRSLSYTAIVLAVDHAAHPAMLHLAPAGSSLVIVHGNERREERSWCIGEGKRTSVDPGVVDRGMSVSEKRRRYDYSRAFVAAAATLLLL